MILLRSIKFYNDPLYGNKKIDFTLNDKPVKNIIIAGKMVVVKLDY